MKTDFIFVIPAIKLPAANSTPIPTPTPTTATTRPARELSNAKNGRRRIGKMKYEFDS